MAEKVQVPALTWRSRAKGLANSLLNFVFPPVCGACKKAGSLLCQECNDQLQWLEKPLCNSCGRPASKVVDCCQICRQRPLPLVKIRAAVLFAYPVTKMIHNLKYNGAFALAEPLGKIMVDAWPRWQMQADWVLPIPLHAERERTRGYNQSTLLSRTFCHGVEMSLQEDALIRTRFTTPQVGLTAGERLQNVQDAFQVNLEVRGKHILLIDDVSTTGATMSEAAKALLAAGASSVSGYCLARAV